MSVIAPDTGGQRSSTTDIIAPTPQRASSLAGAWRAFLVRRLIGIVVGIALLVIVTFLIVELIPGDPATAIAGYDANLAEVARVRTELGLDKPLITQFWIYVTALLHGDFGTSYHYKVPALRIVLAATPYTLAITLTSVVIMVVVGLALGMFVGIATRGKRRRWLDVIFSVITSFLTAIPPYIQATLLVIVFAVWLAWVPPAYSPTSSVGRAAILPIAALSSTGIASIARIVRRETSVILEQDYMRTARGWRLPTSTLYVKHLLPNLLTTSLTLAGLILTTLLGSALIVEAVFAWPGLGTVIERAVAVDQDYPVIRAAVFVIGLISLVVTLLVDIVLGIFDPRTLGEQRHA